MSEHFDCRSSCCNLSRAGALCPGYRNRGVHHLPREHLWGDCPPHLIRPGGQKQHHVSIRVPGVPSCSIFFVSSRCCCFMYCCCVHCCCCCHGASLHLNCSLTWITITGSAVAAVSVAATDDFDAAIATTSDAAYANLRMACMYWHVICTKSSSVQAELMPDLLLCAHAHKHMELLSAHSNRRVVWSAMLTA